MGNNCHHKHKMIKEWSTRSVKLIKETKLINGRDENERTMDSSQKSRDKIWSGGQQHSALIANPDTTC